MSYSPRGYMWRHRHHTSQITVFSIIMGARLGDFGNNDCFCYKFKITWQKLFLTLETEDCYAEEKSVEYYRMQVVWYFLHIWGLLQGHTRVGKLSDQPMLAKFLSVSILLTVAFTNLVSCKANYRQLLFRN